MSWNRKGKLEFLTRHLDSVAAARVEDDKEMEDTHPFPHATSATLQLVPLVSLSDRS